LRMEANFSLTLTAEIKLPCERKVAWDEKVVKPQARARL
jgi:hypothetical protein